MAILNIQVRTSFNGKLILQVEEDYDWGNDILGMPNSLSRTRVRDAEPLDMIEIVVKEVNFKY